MMSFTLDPRILENGVFISTSFHPHEYSKIFKYVKRHSTKDQWIGVTYACRSVGKVNATVNACRVERNTFWFTDSMPMRPRIIRAESRVFSRIDVSRYVRTDLEDHLLHIFKKEDGEWFRYVESHGAKAWTLSFDTPCTEYPFRGDTNLITTHKDSIFNN